MSDPAPPRPWEAADRRALHDALCSAFPSPLTLRLLLRYSVDPAWEAYLSDGPLTQQAAELIQAACARSTGCVASGRLHQTPVGPPAALLAPPGPPRPPDRGAASN